MLNFLFTLIPLLWLLAGGNNPEKYPASELTPALTAHADVVVRSHDTRFIIKNSSDAVEQVHYIYTILNKNAAADAVLKIPYSKFKNINYIKGTLYNKNGQEIQKLKAKEIYDLGGITSNLIDDVRIKVAKLQAEDYPFTVDYEYEINYTGTLFYPTWQPQEKQNFSVQKASFQVIIPKNSGFRYHTLNGASPPQIIPEGNNSVYKWEASGLLAFETQPFQPALAEITPVVYTAPNDFSVENINGNMSTWAGFGNWINQLNTGKANLPEATVNQVKALVANEPTELDKIKKLYAYLQNKTRYVSMQLGLGSWQPFEASFVDTKGYGDCKALTNYMQALLKVAGINSYYTLIRAGENEHDILKDFPSNQFNHALLCVPVSKDTIWLECTSQTGSWGYNGTFTGNRHGLLITPQGGKIVRTAVYGAEKNLLNRIATVQLDGTGNATAQIQTIYTGLQQDNLRQVMAVDTETQRKWLNQHVKLPAFTISGFNFQARDGMIPQITEKMAIQVNKYASQSGKRFFLNPNFINRFSTLNLKKTERNLPIVLNFPYIDSDQITFQLPASTFQPESLPEPILIKSTFGEYKATCIMEANKITYTRTLKMNSGRFPAGNFTELSEFYKKISAADKSQVVLISKT